MVLEENDCDSVFNPQITVSIIEKFQLLETLFAFLQIIPHSAQHRSAASHACQNKSSGFRRLGVNLLRLQCKFNDFYIDIICF